MRLGSFLAIAALALMLVASVVGQQPNSKPAPLSPADAAKTFTVMEGLRFEQVLSEPVVRQPVHLSFDERGRLWVVQYLQYPHPAGLKMLSRDGVWRAVYDKVSPPPPNHFAGADKITIHEDTDGDGTFDKHTIFIEGLNIVTAVAHGRDGVWVLNPPYLLFYPDRDHDDKPDGPPEVHLTGFGIEDTHSCVNSLTWGPDGWLYAAQGSTVSGNVKRYGSDDKPIQSMGQLIWRYHPEKRKYEVFAEGGGNAFGVEIDAVGRIFSGHNGGNTRGFHYVQGGYYQKGFDKHGPLSNPYAFGYFPAMKHNDVPRFTHTFTIYDGVAFPERYRGKHFGIAPLLHHVVLSDVLPDRSSIRTQDLGHAVTSTDPWFTPVDIKLGPDGALYVADWYDLQCNHYRNHEGQIDKSTGRIYRLKAAGTKPLPPFDLAKLSSAELVTLLGHPNRWQRQTALRLLGDRKDKDMVVQLLANLERTSGQTALESLWALRQIGIADDRATLTGLQHHNPHVRRWAVRLACDSNQVGSRVLERLVELARTEPEVEVRSQLASSARRLPAQECLKLVRLLLERQADAEDVHIPLLLWWAVEAKIDSDPAAVLALFESPGFWELPLVRSHLSERVMRRFAATGKRQDLFACAKLLKLTPGPDHTKRLMAGFEQALAGRALSDVPQELAEALAQHGRFSVALGIRQRKPEALAEALAALESSKADRSKQLQYVQVLGEVAPPQALPVLLRLATRPSDNVLQASALAALEAFDDPKVGAAILDAYRSMTDDVRTAAQSLLTSRKSFARAWLEAIDAGKLDARDVPSDVVQRLLRHRDERIATLVKKHWATTQPRTSAELEQEIARLAAVVRSGSGVPKAGRPLFQNTCAKCHVYFGQGANVGPDLTSFKRDDLETMLLHIVNPSAEIREGYESFFVLTKDGRTAHGFLVDKDAHVLVLRGPDGKDVTIRHENVEEIEKAKTSLMPEGLLKGLGDQQVRDLFAYLRMTQPLIDR
jgi:putative heme-binding domain-containing protein